MAERLFELYDELYCRHLGPAARERELETLRAEARLAAPLEGKEEQKEREDNNFIEIAKVFDAIKSQINTDAAIEIFKTYIKSTKPEAVTTNQYYLNLLHLAFAAFNVLARRGDELPSIEDKDCGGGYGKLADKFCIKIIGDAIEKELAPRVRQLLRGGIKHILSGRKPVVRDLDVSGVAVMGAVGSSEELGVNSYFDDIGTAAGHFGYCKGDAEERAEVFQDLLQAMSAASKIYYTAATGPLIAPEGHRSPAAMAVAP